MIPKDAAEVIRRLGLVPHPREGGYFRETYRAAESFPDGSFPSRYEGTRACSTAIYFLLTPETFSEMHRLASDEIFHFYFGDPVEMLLLCREESPRRVVLGCDLAGGHSPQVVVPRGVWQGARLVPGGRHALLGTTVSPGFEYRDYESARREELLEFFPAWRQAILVLTR